MLEKNTRDLLLNDMGFNLDLKTEQYERWKHSEVPNISNFNLIIYPNQVDIVMRLASHILIKIGKYLKAKEIKNALDI